MSIPAYSKREIKRAFEKMESDNRGSAKTGFVFKTSGEINALFYYKGAFILRTAVPKGRGDVAPGTQRDIRSQLQLDWGEFVDFVECPMDKEGFIRSLIESGFIEE